MVTHKRKFFFDFETRSRLDLKIVGAVNYALHPNTEATLLTWAFDRTGPVKVWSLGEPIPLEIVHVATNPESYDFIAFNIAFDYLIWTQSFSRLFNGNLKAPPIENLEDCMALTCHYRVGNSLENAAAGLGIQMTKDKEGRRIMLKQCKPNKKTGEFPELTKQEQEAFVRYGIIDTRLLRDVYYMCPPLPRGERYIWEWTFKRNLRGIKFDLPLIEEMHSIIEEEKPKLVAEFDRLVGGKVKINSPKAKDWFRQYYPWVENMQADTVREMLADDRPEIPDFARRAIEIKALAGSTSLAKVSKALNIGHAGRIYNVLAYHYAHTKRWAGRGIQVQNFPRPDYKADDALPELNQKNLAGEVKARRKAGLKKPLDFVKNLLRRIWLPEEGEYFYCGDWSKIEPTVLFWFLDLGPIPKMWYEEMAAAIYSMNVADIGKDSVERQLGKAAALGCGYGMGHVKFKADIFKKEGLRISIDDSKKAVNAYRSKYYQVRNFWYELEWAFKTAFNGTPATLCNGKLHIMPMPDKYNPRRKNIKVRLPSGGFLYYHDVMLTSEGLTYMDMEGGTKRKKLYGGLLCEHVVSSTAREILGPAIYYLEDAGFDVLNMVHDEIWGCASEGRGEEFERLMCIVPSWCKGMIIKAESDNGVRYLK